jgi:hypothetical protein
LNEIIYKRDAMKTVHLGERTAAVASAISITFAVVWALSSYAYAPPAAAETSQAAGKLLLQKTCS